MKRLALGFGLLVAAGSFWTVLAQPAARTASLRGQIQTPSAEEVVVAVDATGDLPGYLTFSLKRNGPTIVGGTWLLINRRQLPDGTEEELGTAEGTITGGTLAVTPADAVSSVTGLQLRIDEGTGRFESAPGATGTLDGSVAQNATFTGTFSLTF